MNELKQIHNLPPKTQFIAIWVYDGRPWSGTYKYTETKGMTVYNEAKDRWDAVDHSLTWVEGTKFYVVK